MLPRDQTQSVSPTKNLLQESALGLFINMLHIAMICNVFVLSGALFIGDQLLSSACVTLLATSVLGRFLLTSKNTITGIHLVFWSHLIIFTGAAFTHLAIYPTILLYPIIIGHAHLIFQSEKSGRHYSTLGIVFAMANLYGTYLFYQSLGAPVQLSSLLIIGFGLLLSLYVISKRFVGLIGSYQTQLLTSHERVYQKNIELENYIRENLQLENFAHLASHELRTPIKNISNFMGLLGRRLDSRLQPTETEMINLVNIEVDRMNSRLEALLELSQTTNNLLNFERITTYSFLDSAILSNFPHHNSSIILGKMPLSIKGNDNQLKQLFIHLIDNGLKFQTTFKDPQIRVEGEDKGEHYEFSIHDNGIGIEDHLKDRIFLIFKCLHNDADYEGTGIGLAICKKIVERHGGRIWVENSDLGGSAFKFTLAKHLEPQLRKGNDVESKVLQIA